MITKGLRYAENYKLRVSFFLSGKCQKINFAALGEIRFSQCYQVHKVNAKNFEQLIWIKDARLWEWIIYTVTIICRLIELWSFNACTVNWSIWPRHPVGRSEEGLPLLLHLHHLHQGALGGREDPGRLCQGVPGPPSRGICKFASM